nr:metallophosphoesterase [Halobaculum halophilum]
MTPPPRLVHLSDLETLFDRPADVGRVASAVEALRDERTIVVGTGDTTALGSLALATEAGRGHARPFLDAVEPVADTFGNHDFDPGIEWAADWARDTPGTHLAANLDGFDTDAFEPGIVVDVGDVRVGLVGVVNPETATICHAAGALTFTDPVAAVLEETAALRQRGAERVVVLSHCGEADADIARETDVDAVLGAHDHGRVNEVVAGTLVTRTRGGQAGEFGVVTLGEEPAAEVRDVVDAPPDGAITAEYRDRREAACIDAELCSFPAPLPEGETARAVAEAYRSRGDADVGVVLAATVRGGLPATCSASSPSPRTSRRSRSGGRTSPPPSAPVGSSSTTPTAGCSSPERPFGGTTRTGRSPSTARRSTRTGRIASPVRATSRPSASPPGSSRSPSSRTAAHSMNTSSRTHATGSLAPLGSDDTVNDRRILRSPGATLHVPSRGREWKGATDASRPFLSTS